jgi:hypothetical protein
MKPNEYTLPPPLIVAPVVAIIVIFIAIFAWADQKETENAKKRELEKAAKVAACLASIECQDDEAKLKSRLSTSPVRSSTGQWFFQGNACESACEGHVAGYRWAEKIGATKEAACEQSNSYSFQEGCLSFVMNSEPETVEDDLSGYEYEDCGRYAC